MSVGTVAAGRIGYAVLKRMKAFDCELHYTDRHRLTPEQEAELNLTYHETVEDMVKVCDVVTINCPLHPGPSTASAGVFLIGLASLFALLVLTRFLLSFLLLCDRDGAPL